MKLKMYRCAAKIKGGGAYIPPDPVCGGDYHADRYESYVITCTSQTKARAAVKSMHPGCTVTVFPLGDA